MAASAFLLIHYLLGNKIANTAWFSSFIKDFEKLFHFSTHLLISVVSFFFFEKK